MTTTANTQLIAKFKPLFEPIRYKVFYGGRAGLKSWSIAQALVIIASQKKTRILCARELQNSINDSVHKLLTDTIARLGIEEQFVVTDKRIVHQNGSSIVFKGLKNNITTMKSFEGVDIVWIEEAEAVADKSWDILIPTIRKPGAEIWMSFNPFDELDATYSRFVTPYQDDLIENEVYRDENIYVCKTTYKDNPWMTDTLTVDRLQCKTTNYAKYQHIWLGEPNRDYEDAVIKPEWVEAAIDAHIKLDWHPRGARVIGFDPADTGTDKKAYIERYGSLVTNADQWLNGDLEDSTQKTYDSATVSNCTYIVYDSIGIGAGARIKFNQINKKGINIQGFCGSESPALPWVKYKDDQNNRDVFKNRRAQGYWYLRDRFEATYMAVVKGEPIAPEDMISLSSTLKHLKQLKSELSKIQRKLTRSENNLIQIESKQDMKARGVKSPNLADALMYAFSNTTVRKPHSDKPPMRWGHK